MYRHCQEQRETSHTSMLMNAYSDVVGEIGAAFVLMCFSERLFAMRAVD